MGRQRSGEKRGGEGTGGTEEGKERGGATRACTKKRAAHDDMLHYMIPRDPPGGLAL